MPKSAAYVGALPESRLAALPVCLECASPFSRCGFWNERVRPGGDSVLRIDAQTCTCAQCERRVQALFDAGVADAERLELLRRVHCTRALERALFALPVGDHGTRSRAELDITRSRVPVLYLRQYYHRAERTLHEHVFCAFTQTLTALLTTAAGERLLRTTVLQRRAHIDAAYHFTVPAHIDERTWRRHSVWAACAVRVVGAYDAAAAEQRRGERADETLLLQLQLFADTHLDLLTYAELFDTTSDAWMHTRGGAHTRDAPAALGLTPLSAACSPFERFYPHPLRGAAATECADLTASLDSGNVFRDVRPKERDEVSACMHVLLSKTQNHKCTIRSFDDIVCEYARQYPALLDYLLCIAELAYLGNYPGRRFRPLWAARKAVRRSFHFERIETKPQWCESCKPTSRRRETVEARGSRNWCPQCPQTEPRVWCAVNCGQFDEERRGIGAGASAPYCPKCDARLDSDERWAMHRALNHTCEHCTPRTHSDECRARPHLCAFCTYTKEQSLLFFYAIKEFYAFQVRQSGTLERMLVERRKWAEYTMLLRTGMDEMRSILSRARGGPTPVAEMRNHLLLVHHCNKPTVCKLLKGSFRSVVLAKLNSAHNEFCVDDHDTRPQRSRDVLDDPSRLLLRDAAEVAAFREAVARNDARELAPFERWAMRSARKSLRKVRERFAAHVKQEAAPLVSALAALARSTKQRMPELSAALGAVKERAPRAFAQRDAFAANVDAARRAVDVASTTAEAACRPQWQSKLDKVERLLGEMAERRDAREAARRAAYEIEPRGFFAMQVTAQEDQKKDRIAAFVDKMRAEGVRAAYDGDYGEDSAGDTEWTFWVDEDDLLRSECKDANVVCEEAAVLALRKEMAAFVAMVRRHGRSEATAARVAVWRARVFPEEATAFFKNIDPLDEVDAVPKLFTLLDETVAEWREPCDAPVEMQLRGGELDAARDALRAAEELLDACAPAAYERFRLADADAIIAASEQLASSLVEWRARGYTLRHVEACVCAAVDAVRADATLDRRLPLAPLRWCGMSARGHALLQRLYFNYAMCDMPDNDIKPHLVEIYRHRTADFHLAHVFFEKFAELENERSMRLSTAHVRAQTLALRMRYHIPPWEPLPPQLDVFYYCRAHEYFYAACVEPARHADAATVVRRHRGDAASASATLYELGVSRPQFDYVTRRLYCSKDVDSSIAKQYRRDGLLDENMRMHDASRARSVRKKREQELCQTVPLREVHMIGYMRRVGKHIYALCCVCGGLAEVRDGKQTTALFECMRHHRYDTNATYTQLREFAPPTTDQVDAEAVRARASSLLGKPWRIAEAFVRPMRAPLPLVVPPDTPAALYRTTPHFDAVAADRRYLVGAPGSRTLMLQDDVLHSERLAAARSDVPEPPPAPADVPTSVFDTADATALVDTEVPVAIVCAFCQRRCEQNTPFTRLSVHDSERICVRATSTVLVSIYLCASHFRHALSKLRTVLVPTAFELFVHIRDEKEKANRRAAAAGRRGA